MDPLSVATGVVTLIGAGSTVGNGLKRVIDLRHAPDILKALQDDLSCASLFASNASGEIQKAATTLDQQTVNAACNAHDRLNSAIDRLERFIAYKLTIPTDSGKAIRPDKSVWLRAGPRIRELSEDLRARTSDLHNSLLVLLLYRSTTSMHHVLFQNIRGQLQTLPDELNTAIRGWHNTSMEEGRLLPLSNHIDQALPKGPGSVFQRQLPVKNVIKDPKRSSEIKWASPASADAFSGCTQYISRKEQCNMGYRPYEDVACSSDCSCDCHTSSPAKFYSVSNFMFGSKLFQFSTSTSSTRSCNDPRCSTPIRRISYTYTFPSWLFFYAITATISRFRSSGPEFNLRLMNIVDRRNREDVLFSPLEWQQRRLESELKRQLDTGEASIFDIDEFGTSSVLHAATFENWDVVDLLIGYGADLHYQNKHGWSAYEYIWELYLEGQFHLTFIPARMHPIFSFSCACDLLEFSKLHKAYLKGSPKLFGQVLQSVSRIEVDARDRFGRTVLSWAAGHDEIEAVRSLLLCGANPNTKDRCGETPLHHAARSRAEKSLSLLLSAKADPLLTDAAGYTPVDVASSNSVRMRLFAAGSRWGSRTVGFPESVLACRDLNIFDAFMAGGDLDNDPKYNMREWSKTYPTQVSSIEKSPHAVEVLSFYVALRLSSQSHVPLLEAHLRLKPFEFHIGPTSDDWSIYRVEQQDASADCYVILQRKWSPGKPRTRRAGTRKARTRRAGKVMTDFDEAIRDEASRASGYTYIGPVGRKLEKWYNEFKQRKAYLTEKQRKWEVYRGTKIREYDSSVDSQCSTPNSQKENDVSAPCSDSVGEGKSVTGIFQKERPHKKGSERFGSSDRFSKGPSEERSGGSTDTEG